MKKIITCYVLCMLILLSGCAAQEKKNDFNIVTSFYPVYITVLNLTNGIDGVSVSNMAQNHTGCLHDYQVQTKDMRNLEKADTFIINGAGMEDFLDKIVSQHPNLSIIDASKGFEIQNENSHVWVSIEGCIYQTEQIAKALILADAKNEDAYRKNADEYINKLKELSKKMHDKLDTLKNRKIVTMHEAFSYFADEFSLDIVGVINREPESTPDAKELAETVELIKSLKVKAVFAEPQYSDSAADTIAKETGATVYFLDPVTSGENDANAYINAMEKNLAVLEEALK